MAMLKQGPHVWRKMVIVFHEKGIMLTITRYSSNYTQQAVHIVILLLSLEMERIGYFSKKGFYQITDCGMKTFQSWKSSGEPVFCLRYLEDGTQESWI